MIEKRSIVEQIEVTRNGTIQVRIAKQIVEDGKVLSQEWHRTSIPPAGSVDQQMGAVNAHLKQMGCCEVSESDINRIKAVYVAANK